MLRKDRNRYHPSRVDFGWFWLFVVFDHIAEQLHHFGNSDDYKYCVWRDSDNLRTMRWQWMDWPNDLCVWINL